MQQLVACELLFAYNVRFVVNGGRVVRFWHNTMHYTAKSSSWLVMSVIAPKGE